MEELLYSTEHLSCSTNVQGATPIIELINFANAHRWQGRTTSKEIVFVLEGNFHISYDFFLDLHVPTGNMLLLPPGCLFTARTGEGVYLLVMRLSEAIYFCDKYYLEDLIPQDSLPQGIVHLLEIKPMVASLLSFLVETMNSGLTCKHFMELKTKEFFFFLKNYYTKEELSAFFRPLLNADAQFAEFVLGNYHHVKTVNQFAALCSCSLSNFDKKFRRTFGTSAYQWMMQKRNERVFHEINTTNKPFLQIAEEQGFSSNSQFTDYCKKHLGAAPGKIRGRRNAGALKFIRQKEEL